MNKKWLYVGVTILLLVAVALTFYFASRTDSSSVTAEYTVKAGDTCTKIAYEHNISVESLVEANKLAPDCSNLAIDQKLIIPAP
jgi:LysM repeat protein